MLVQVLGYGIRMKSEGHKEAGNVTTASSYLVTRGKPEGGTCCQPLQSHLTVLASLLALRSFAKSSWHTIVVGKFPSENSIKFTYKESLI